MLLMSYYVIIWVRILVILLPLNFTLSSALMLIFTDVVWLITPLSSLYGEKHYIILNLINGKSYTLILLPKFVYLFDMTLEHAKIGFVHFPLICNSHWNGTSVKGKQGHESSYISPNVVYCTRLPRWLVMTSRSNISGISRMSKYLTFHFLHDVGGE